jgi:hypothetical protein
MIEPKPANPYDARICATRRIAGGDGRSAFKVYFLDIVGRADPARYEWDRCATGRDVFLASLRGVADGVGFVTAFPHVTKVFRFSPHLETVLDVRGFRTSDLSEYPLARGDGTFEFACLAEALIAADEYGFWASAAGVDEYLGRWSTFASARIADPGKLGRYWRSGAPAVRLP